MDESVRVLQSFQQPRSTTNPYIVMLQRALDDTPGLTSMPFRWATALVGRYDVIHLHWPDTLFEARDPVRRAGKLLVCALWTIRIRAGRIPVVRTVHNLDRPGHGRGLRRALVRSLERRSSVWILLNDTTPVPADVASVVIPHGHYREWYRAYEHASATPGRLAYFGFIRPYKGVERLITAFPTFSREHRDASLAIAGSPATDALAEELTALIDGHPGVTFRPEFLDDAGLVRHVTSAELVVLPYRNLHNSGSALAALSLDRPVLAPRNAATEALAAEVGPVWVSLFDGELTAADLSSALLAARTATGRPDLSARDWSGAGTAHLHAYRLATGSAVRHQRPCTCARISRS
jgi:beta-1,4-mannosyltransferase